MMKPSAEQRAGKHHQIDQEKQSDQQHDRAAPVRRDMSVQTVGRHDPTFRALLKAISELDLRRLFELAARFAEIEEFAAA